MVVCKVAGVQDLSAGIVIPAKGSDGGWTACRLSRVGRAKPQSQVVRVNGIERRIQACIWERASEYDWRGRAARGRGKGFNTETADEPFVSSPVFVGVDLSLIPGHTEGRLGDLDDEELELCVWGQTLYRDFHDLDGPGWCDLDRAAGAGEARLGPCRDDHVEFYGIVRNVGLSRERRDRHEQRKGGQCRQCL